MPFLLSSFKMNYKMFLTSFCKHCEFMVPVFLSLHLQISDKCKSYIVRVKRKYLFRNVYWNDTWIIMLPFFSKSHEKCGLFFKLLLLCRFVYEHLIKLTSILYEREIGFDICPITFASYTITRQKTSLTQSSSAQSLSSHKDRYMSSCSQ